MKRYYVLANDASLHGNFVYFVRLGITKNDVNFKLRLEKLSRENRLFFVPNSLDAAIFIRKMKECYGCELKTLDNKGLNMLLCNVENLSTNL